MQRRRSVSYKFEENGSAEKATLQAEIARLEALLALLGKCGPELSGLRKIRQANTASHISRSLSSSGLQPPK